MKGIPEKKSWRCQWEVLIRKDDSSESLAKWNETGRVLYSDKCRDVGGYRILAIFIGEN